MGVGMGDYNRVVTGNGAAAAAALRAKQVDAVVLWDSAYAGLENTGLKMRYIPITDQKKLGSNTFVTSDAFMKANEQLVAKFCRAVAKSYYFARISQEAAVRAFMEENPTFRPASMPIADATRDYLHVFQAYLNGATAGAPLDAKIGEIEAPTLGVQSDLLQEHGASQRACNRPKRAIRTALQTAATALTAPRLPRQRRPTPAASDACSSLGTDARPKIDGVMT